MAAEWGGLGAGLRGDVDGVFGPGNEAYYRTYAASAARFLDVATRAGADVLLAPHPGQAGASWKVPLLATRKPGDPHPFVVGKDGVRNALTVITECAVAHAEQEAAYPTKK